jgi:hypothetical protein
MTEKSENFENITEYYAQLTNESKIYFTNTLFKLGLEKVSKVLFDSMFSDDMLEYTSDNNLQLLNDEDDSDSYIEYTSEDADSILDLKRIDDNINNDLYVVIDIDLNLIHLYSNNLQDIENYKNENIFLKGMFFTTDIIRENTKDYKYYECATILGQLEQDICYN